MGETSEDDQVPPEPEQTEEGEETAEAGEAEYAFEGFDLVLTDKVVLTPPASPANGAARHG